MKQTGQKLLKTGSYLLLQKYEQQWKWLGWHKTGKKVLFSVVPLLRPENIKKI